MLEWLFQTMIFFRQEMEEREQHGLAIMQIVVVLVFVVCNFLAMLSNIFELFDIFSVNLTFVSNFLVTLNHSVNLFIYCAFGEKFRKELKRMLNQARRKSSRYCCVKSEHKSEDIPLNSYYSNSRVRKSLSRPGNIRKKLLRQMSEKNSKFFFESNQYSCDNMYKLQTFSWVKISRNFKKYIIK